MTNCNFIDVTGNIAIIKIPKINVISQNNSFNNYEFWDRFSCGSSLTCRLSLASDRKVGL